MCAGACCVVAMCGVGLLCELQPLWAFVMEVWWHALMSADWSAVLGLLTKPLAPRVPRLPQATSDRVGADMWVW